MSVATYEQRLSSNARWALSEGSKFFEEKSAVQETLRKITKRLDDLKVPYAVAGAMALFQHGYRRFTEDVDLLVTRAALQAIHEALDGLGYVPPFQGSKNLRDAEFGVKIEFIVTGEYPGDGKPKPVAFPEPADVAIELGGVRCVNLPTLLTLKIASGMTNAARLKDLADVQEVIKRLKLPRAFGDQLHAYVQDKYRELWDSVQNQPVEE
ncbi:MAG: nucleotidyl transferase AbiEii/AbiGii toxin family protein [Planctomycetes bacterium]|nr:nucleotidyl transferase AbiEii/AbiGii toxin family protein [Planctomycetota bacterium]